MIFSFKTLAPREVDLPEHLHTIGEGVDVFTITVSDLAAFKALLEVEGVEILECNALDDLEPVEPTPDLLAEMHKMQQFPVASGLKLGLHAGPPGGGDEQDLP